MDLTPIHSHNGFFFKRDDLFQLHGACGGKLRQALALLQQGAKGLVGYGGRFSNTALAMAAAGKELNKPIHFHTAQGGVTEEITSAALLGAKVFYHKPGYLSVLAKRACDDAREKDFTLGLQHQVCVDTVTHQASNLASVPYQRIVVALGACVTLAGICQYLLANATHKPIVGVLVGAPPNEDFLDDVVPAWRDLNLTLVRSEYKYEQSPPLEDLHPVNFALDRLYEAKCVKFLQEGDLLWVSGCRLSRKCIGTPANK